MKKKIIVLIICMFLFIPFITKAYTEPALYFQGAWHHGSADGEGWAYDYPNQTLILTDYTFNGFVRDTNLAYTLIEADLDNLTIEINGENNVYINGIVDKAGEIIHDSKYACYASDYQFLNMDTTMSYFNGTYYQNDSHVTFTGNGTLNVHITGGNNMYGITGNSVRVNGPTINIYITGLDDWDGSADKYEGSNSLQAINVNELIIDKGSLTTNCYGDDEITEVLGMRVVDLTLNDGNLSIYTDSSVPVKSNEVCRVLNLDVNGGKLVCDGTDVTNNSNKGNTLYGISYGLYIDTLNMTGGEIQSTAGDIVNADVDGNGYSYGLRAGTLNVSGGKITASSGLSVNENLGIYATMKADISGGEITAISKGCVEGDCPGYGFYARDKFYVSKSPIIKSSGNYAFNKAPSYSKPFTPVIYAGNEEPGELVETITNDTYYNKYVKIANGYTEDPNPGEPEEPTFEITFDYNGGTKNGKSSNTYNWVAIGYILISENLLDGVIVPNNKELEAVEINGVRYELNSVFVTNINATIKYLWKSTLKEMVTPVLSITASDNSFTLSWDEQEVVTKIEIYRSTSKTKNYKKIATVTNNSYVNTSLTYGTTYYYKIRAYNGTKWSSYSNIVNKKVVPNKVENLRLESVGPNNVKVSYDKVNTTGYQIQRSTDNKKWTTVTTISKNSTLSYNNTKLSPNKKYYYRVRAYKKVGSRKTYGSWSSTLIVKTTPIKPSLSSRMKELNEINISIGMAKGANRYSVEKSIDDINYESLEVLSQQGTISDTAVETGTKYYYRVRACEDELCSPWSTSSLVATTKTPTISLKTSSKKVTITVNPVLGATGYEIYRSYYSNKKFSLVKTFTSEDELLEFINSTKKGKTYYYKVRAFVQLEDKKVYSPYSSVKKIKSK